MIATDSTPKARSRRVPTLTASSSRGRSIDPVESIRSGIAILARRLAIGVGAG
ncbi:unannotated protein [freshwater metagenome]|uniref:Unannotated protein n=1 Tax=freshwater metagenome TaxID=449393 RepID=A0A6J7HMG2_9ZZZZ